MLLAFFSGAVVMGFALAGLFFLKFWSKTHDELFLSFTLAFWLLGLCQALLEFSNVPTEERSGFYLIRLLAFAIILIAIWRKNVRTSA